MSSLAEGENKDLKHFLHLRTNLNRRNLLPQAVLLLFHIQYFDGNGLHCRTVTRHAFTGKRPSNAKTAVFEAKDLLLYIRHSALFA